MKYCLKKDPTKNDFVISSSSTFFILFFLFLWQIYLFFWWLIIIRYGSGTELSRVGALWVEGVLN